MKPYESYTDVGEEWICKIPSHWKVTKLKFLSSENVTYGINISSDNYQENGIRFIRTTDIDEFGNIIDKGVYLKKEDVEEIYLLIDGDFLISRSGTVGRAYVHQEHFGEACYAGYLVRFRFLGSQVAKYIFWFTKTTQFQLWLDFQRIESTISNVNGQKYANLSIGMPISKNEIGQIINFINSKTAQIDTLIANKQRLIGLLQEYRTALINQAVTKGLDPNVPMKDSGYEWLGKVPEHWDIKKLKYLSNVNFSNVDKHTFDEEIPVQLCNYVDVYKNDFIDTNIKFMKATAKENEIEKFQLIKGDVLITKDSETWDDIAVPAYVTESMDMVICGYHLAQIRPLSINGNYLFWVFKSPSINDQYKVEAHGITRYGLGKDAIENSFITCPPYNEQQEISFYLNNKTRLIDKLIIHIDNEIHLFTEYRTSLISASVTGKIDVRNQG